MLHTPLFFQSTRLLNRTKQVHHHHAAWKWFQPSCLSFSEINCFSYHKPAVAYFLSFFIMSVIQLICFYCSSTAIFFFLFHYFVKRPSYVLMTLPLCRNVCIIFFLISREYFFTEESLHSIKSHCSNSNKEITEYLHKNIWLKTTKQQTPHFHQATGNTILNQGQQS